MNRRGFIGTVAGALAALVGAVRGAGAAARDFERDLATFPNVHPQLGDTVLIRQWSPLPKTGPGYRDWTMVVTGLAYQVSNDGDTAADFRLLLSGYQDPGDGLGRRTFNLDLRMDQTRFVRAYHGDRPASVVKVEWWPWGGRPANR